MRRLEVFCKLIFLNLEKWQSIKNIFSSSRIFENVVQDKDKFAENSDAIVLFLVVKILVFVLFFKKYDPL